MSRNEGELRDLAQRLQRVGARLSRLGRVGLYAVGALDALRFALCEDSSLERIVESLEQSLPAEPGQPGANG